MTFNERIHGRSPLRWLVLRIRIGYTANFGSGYAGLGEWEGELELGQGRSSAVSAEFFEDGSLTITGIKGSTEGKWNIPENEKNTTEEGRMTLTSNDGSPPEPGGYIFSAPDSLRINLTGSRLELKRKE